MSPTPARKKFPWIDDYTIKKAKIRWRNFEGRADTYNAAGDRNFAIFLTPEDSDRLTSMGLNVKTLPPKEEGQEPLDFLKVKVNYKGRPPRLVLVTHRGRTNLDEATASLMDTAQIARNEHDEELVDLIISPYWYEVNGKEGVAVSLKAIYVTIVEDELEMMYGDIPEASDALRNLNYTPDEEHQEPSGPVFR